MNNTEGAELLDEVRVAVTKYCIMPSAHAEVAVTLWVAATHALEAFENAPRLVVRSAEKRSGKSRLIELVHQMVFKPLRHANATTSYIFRSITGDKPPTLLFDEADTIFGSKKVAENNEDLRGLLNAGFQRGLPVGRTVGPNHTPTEFQTFAMAALAGIGKMPDTIEDRAVVVIMRRRKPTETVSPYRTRRDKPPLIELGHRLAAWAAEILDDITDYEPENMGVEDRAADTWEPLIAVADKAGGAWPKLARDAARSMTEDAAEDDGVGSLNITLLRDIREVFGDKRFLQSADLCDLLLQQEESPWKQLELNPSKLGWRLREYGIKTGHEDSAKSRRGYLRNDFRDAFDRYLPVTPSKGAEGVRKAGDQQERPDGFETPDTLKVSDEIKVSDDSPSSDPMRTPSGGFGQGYGQESATAGDLGTEIAGSPPPPLINPAEPANRGAEIAERLNRESGVWQISGEPINVQ